MQNNGNGNGNGTDQNALLGLAGLIQGMVTQAMSQVWDAAIKLRDEMWLLAILEEVTDPNQRQRVVDRLNEATERYNEEIVRQEEKEKK